MSRLKVLGLKIQLNNHGKSAQSTNAKLIHATQVFTSCSTEGQAESAGTLVFTVKTEVLEII
jgi:hypothetical protein